MSEDVGSSCPELEELLVDYVDGSMSRSEASRIEEHCSSCTVCSEAVAALREVPDMLRVEAEQARAGADHDSPEFWSDQRRDVLTRIGEIEQAAAARTQGFDVRLLLPLAAAVAIAIAGVISLQSLGGGPTGTQSARAALGLAMEDPLVVAELQDTMGEPLMFSDAVWGDEPLVDGGDRWIGRELTDLEPLWEDLDEMGIEGVEELLGADWTASG